MCEDHGTRFLYFVPPALGDAGESVIADIRSSGIAVLEPFKVNELASSYFRDGFHLNERGAGVLTRKLADELDSQLPELSDRTASNLAPREITQ
jgi:lysophospholipase L1-like esterase